MFSSACAATRTKGAGGFSKFWAACSRIDGTLSIRVKIFSLIVDLRARPIAHSARALDSIHIIAGEGRVSCAPGPKIRREFIERIALLRVNWFDRNDNDKQNCPKNFHVLVSVLPNRN